MIKIDKITLNNFRFFTDDYRHNTFGLNGKNMLLYGENGSGKSSIFKAFEFLAQTNIDKEMFLKSKNIFSTHKPFIKFNLDNDKEIIIDEDNLDNNYSYLEALEIYKPMLEYKNLLKIHYQTDKSKEEINIYDMLRELFREYPIDENRVLGDIKNPNLYYDKLKEIINSKVLSDINSFLKKFDDTFYIKEFFFDMEFTEDGKVEFIVNVKIDFMNNSLDVYHHFLNEARLSALAIAIYFAIIRNVSDTLSSSALKLLILDDVLISLDMSNRLSLITILKEYFYDFQILLFTHDKNFFEVLKEKMRWKSYEIYIDNNSLEKPFIKKSLNYFESAKKYFDEYDYPACANYLRKEVERLKKLKEQKETSINSDKKIFKKLKKMILSTDLSDIKNRDRVCGKLIGFKEGLEDDRDSEVEIDLKDLRGVTDRILNPQSHDDTSRPLYKKELQEAIKVIDGIRSDIENR
jgi:ABC-type lipoprotein export system ATPase subunit